MPLVGPPLHALMYGTLFAVLMLYVSCSMRFPIDPSAVEPPYRQLCSIVTIVNACFALVSIACVQITAEYLQHLRVR
ncbi:MAG: hypothetical protein HY812_17090 [Planctomycetes bacterium]|nr:hypothetical protein [Planctomycetota bacterium]